MPGTIDSTVTRKHDREVEQDAKREQKEAEKHRTELREEGPVEQRPGEMPPQR